MYVNSHLGYVYIERKGDKILARLLTRRTCVEGDQVVKKGTRMDILSHGCLALRLEKVEVLTHV